MLTQLQRLQQLAHWYQQPLGNAVRQAEQEQLMHVLPSLFGLNIVQLGLPSQPQWLDPSPVNTKIIALPYTDTNAQLITDVDQIALDTDSIDVVLLPHILEAVDQPISVLADIQRILIPEGHLIILGFNPWSLWGISHALLGKRRLFSWHERYISLAKLRQNLINLDFTMRLIAPYFYRPALTHPRLLRTSFFLEKVGQFVWPYPGGGYIVVAQKHVIGRTPLKQRWRLSELVINNSFVQPTP
ncbi:MAG: class I SAM-dependent methyltransferase [Gammaproteobacteria bacterium]